MSIPDKQTNMSKKAFALVISMTGIMAFMLSSCQSNNNSSSTKSMADSLSSKAAAATTSEAEDSGAEIMLPSPLQIGSIFKHAGLVYMPGLTNTIQQIDHYNSSYSQAVNMGVCGADLSYCVLNKQTQEALDYIKALRGLGSKLGLGSIFESNALMKRFQTNLNSEDSLTSIITDMQMDADTYLATNHQKSVSTMTFAGAWVESMYIGSKVNADKKSDNISERISEQMTILENLIRSLTKYKTEDTHIADLIASLKVIEDTYKGFDEIKNMKPDNTQITKISDDHITELSKEIQDLRAKLIM
jgi:hypothetical protein